MDCRLTLSINTQLCYCLRCLGGTIWEIPVNKSNAPCHPTGRAMHRRGYVGLIQNALSATAWVAALAVVVPAANAEAKQIVLNCEIEEGASQGQLSTQIMIDEDDGIVIYHFQYHKGSGPLRKLQLESPLPEGVPREKIIDVSMKITMNNDNFIMANDHSGAFVITKHDGRFVYSFVTPVPTKDGNWFAFGNTHWGTCVKSPFD